MDYFTFRENKRLQKIEYIKSWGDDIEEPLWSNSGGALEDKYTRVERMSITFNTHFNYKCNDSWNMLYIYDNLFTVN